MKIPICSKCGKEFEAEVPDDAENIVCFKCNETSGTYSYHFFECKVCGYDSAEAKNLPITSNREEEIIVRTRLHCPLCLEDCGHSNLLTVRDATKEEVQKYGPGS